ncbi:MAG: glycosyltransferase family 2 protein, partial [Planctomycetota bacterium]
MIELSDGRTACTARGDMEAIRRAMDYWPMKGDVHWMAEGFEPGLVTVVIPTHNRAQLLAQALASVQAQTYRPIELIVVDDGSTDDTPDLMQGWAQECSGDKQFELRYLAQPNRGAPTARNRGLIESRGEYIQFMDSDDLLHPRKLELQVNVLAADPECDFVCSETARFTDVPDYQAEPWCGTQHHRLLPDFINHLLWQTGSGLYRRSACTQIGPWREELVRWQDWEYNIRFACLRPSIRYVPGVLSLLREHGGGRIDDLVSSQRGVRGGFQAVAVVEEHLRKAGLDERTLGCEIARRYYRIAHEAMEA